MKKMIILLVFILLVYSCLVSAFYTSDTDLIGYWNLDDSGTVIVDSKDNSRNQTNLTYDGILNQQTAIPSYSTYSLGFNGANDRLNGTPEMLNYFNSMSEFTVGCWVKGRGYLPEEHEHIMGTRYSDSGVYNGFVALWEADNGGSLRCGVVDNNNHYNALITGYNYSEYLHICVLNSSGISLWVNDTLMKNVTGTMGTSVGTFSIGFEYQSLNSWVYGSKGLLDECFVINRSLNQSEITAIKENGIKDTIKPTYTNWKNNASDKTKINGVVNWSINYADNIGLNYYFFAHNQSGTLTNVSNGSLFDVSAFINYTLTITKTRGNFICGQFWANDTYNNVNQTNLSCFTVQNTAPILKTDLAFKNSSAGHNFTVNVTFTDKDNGSDFYNKTIGFSSGDCDYHSNVTLEDDITLIYNCSGTALATTTIQINVSDTAAVYANSSIITTAYPNQAPTMTSTQLNLTSGVVDTDDLNCSATGIADLDNDATTYHYEWYNNSVIQGYDNVMLGNSNLTSGDNWYCEAWADDTYANSSKYSSSTVTIGSSEVSPTIITANATTALTGVNSTSTFPTNNNSWLNMSVLFTDAGVDEWTGYFCDTPTWDDCQANASGEILCKSISNQSAKTLSCIYNVTGYTGTNPLNWYVFVLDNTSKQSTSKLATFEVNYPPGIPSSVFPQDNSYIPINHTLINWTATDPDSDVINYTLYVNSSTFNYTLFYNGTAKGFNFTNATTENETYYWRIFTKDEHSYGYHNVTLGNFTTDFSAPSTGLTQPTGTKTSRTNIGAVFNIDDFSPLDTCWYSIGRTSVEDEIANTTFTCTDTTITFSVTLDAIFTFYLTANDSAGNRQVSSIGFTVDTSGGPGPGGGGGAPPILNVTGEVQAAIELAAICGNGICQPGENPLNCPTDCSVSLESLFCPIFNPKECAAWAFNLFVYMIVGTVLIVVYRKQIGKPIKFRGKKIA